MASARSFMLAALALAVCARSEAAEPFSEGIVSLTFDDGYMTQFQNARPLLASHGFRATFYVNLWGGRHMTAVEATALVNDGHEIGSHTKGHNHLTQISDEGLFYEIRGSQEDLMTRLGLDKVPSLAFPYGEYDDRVLRVVMQYYDSSRTTRWYHNYRDTNRYELGSYGINALAVIKPLIDRAIAQRSWLILCVHDVEVGTPIYGGVRVSDFAEVLDYLRDSGVRVLTVSEAVALMNVPGPALVGVSPVSGPAGGGNVVTLSGADFANGATVQFGGDLANVVTRSSTSIDVVVPPHPASTVDVVVTNPDGQRSTLAAAYTFDSPRDSYAVVGLGSSTIAGAGASMPATSTLATRLGAPWTVTNAGVGGETCAQITTRWTNTVRPAGYGTLIGHIGMNDIWAYGATGAATWDCAVQIYDEARADGMRVLPMTFQGCQGFVDCNGDHAQLYNNLVRAYCATHGLTCIDYYAETTNPATGALKLEYDSGDHLHGNQAAQDWIASQAYAAIVALPPGPVPAVPTIDPGFPVQSRGMVYNTYTARIVKVTTPGTNRLIVAILTADGGTRPGSGTVSGGGLTWTKRSQSLEGSVVHADVWSAWAPNVLTNASIRWDPPATGGDFDAQFSVFSIAGATQTIGAVAAKPMSAGPDAQAVTITPQAVGSLVLGGFYTLEDSATTLTPNSETTWLGTYYSGPYGNKQYVGRLTNGTASTSPITIGCGNSYPYSGALAVEVKSGGTPATNSPPVANAGSDQTVVDSDGNGTESVLLDGTASIDPDGAIVSYTWSEGTATLATGPVVAVELPVGTHSIALTAVDDRSATASDSMVAVVQPRPATNSPPVANAGSDQTVVDSDGNGTQSVLLDGAASFDPDGAIVSYTWREGGATIATGATPTVSLAVGTHNISLTVVDANAATATDFVTVTVNPPGPVPAVPTIDPGFPVQSRGMVYNTYTARIVKVTTPGTNRLIVAIFTADGGTRPGSGTVSGGGLTWTKHAQSLEGSVVHAAVWTAWAPNALTNASIRWDPPATGGDFDARFSVFSIAGATQTIGAVAAKPMSAGPDAQAVTITPQAIGSLVLGGFYTLEDSATTLTPNSDTTWLGTYYSGPYGNKQYVGRLTNGTASTSPITIGCGNSYPYSGALAVEVKLGGTAATNSPPLANAGSDQAVVDSDGNGNQSVLLDGTASFDPDGAIVSYTWQREEPRSRPARWSRSSSRSAPIASR
jgi:peptidoglycan/xylan/chitin deacetylase (PgdA/CDA1 family)